MIAFSNSPASLLRSPYRVSPALVLWTVISTASALAALFGGMANVVLLLAIGLGVFVWRCPKEAPSAGLLFLFTVQILLPYSARFNGESSDMSQMYFWATGLLIITVAAVIRLGLRRVFDVPLAAKTFLCVALASAIYATAHGAATSYAVRQFYGILMLVVYLGIALHVGDEELLLRRSRTLGVLCVVAFIGYYAAIFGEYGFHKEAGTNGAQASMFAILFVIAGVKARKISWVLSGLGILLVPTLLFERRDLVAFLVALPIALAVKSKGWKLKLACCCLAALLALPGIFPQIAASVADHLKETPIIGDAVPSSAQDATTLYERAIQAEFALNALRIHPWLGEGLGSTFQWDSPTLGYLEGGYVDSGWGYLFQKMGLMGAGTFLWFLITIFRGASRESVGLTACLFSAAIVTMFSEPVFFHFTTAPFLGTFAGLLLAKKGRVHTTGDSCRPTVA